VPFPPVSVPGRGITTTSRSGQPRSREARICNPTYLGIDTECNTTIYTVNSIKGILFVKYLEVGVSRPPGFDPSASV